MSEAEKMQAFGEMVWGMIQTVLLCPPDDLAYSLRKVTFPTAEDRRQRGHVTLVVVRDEGLLVAFERAISGYCAERGIQHEQVSFVEAKQ